jgi:hypothetical protein
MAEFVSAPDPQSPQALRTAQVPAAPPRPMPVVVAVWLMYAGAAGPPLWALGTSLWPTPSNFGGPPSTAADILPYALLVLPVTALWLWMAMMNKRGRSWARILSTAFFGVYCVSLIPLPLIVLWAPGDGNPSPQKASQLFWYALLGLAAPVLLGWAISLATIVLLWQRKSSEYYASAGPLHRGAGKSDPIPTAAG